MEGKGRGHSCWARDNFIVVTAEQPSENRDLLSYRQIMKEPIRIRWRINLSIL